MRQRPFFHKRCPIIILGILISGLLYSCKPPFDSDEVLPEDIRGAFIVLNEGLFQQNNSTLTWFHWHTQQQSNDLFEKKNFLGMGDTGNDIGIYGEKLYVLMNNSHIVHVLNKRTGRLIEQINLIENGIGASPRRLTFHEDKIYITAFNGYLYKIDTSSLTVDDKLLLGSNPDNLLLFEDELWVSNSGGLIESGDSTMSIVDLVTFTETSRISVGRNPGGLVHDASNIYVACRGDYLDIPSKLVKINAVTKTVDIDKQMSISRLHYYAGKLYALGYSFESTSSSLQQINPETLDPIGPNLIENLEIETLYSVETLHVFGQEIFVFLDARGFVHQGKAIVTNTNFDFLFSFSTGLNPSKIVFNAL
jgi:DNA-binding beta-propeller fold protein YncE